MKEISCTESYLILKRYNREDEKGNFIPLTESDYLKFSHELNECLDYLWSRIRAYSNALFCEEKITKDILKLAETIKYNQVKILSETGYKS